MKISLLLLVVLAVLAISQSTSGRSVEQADNDFQDANNAQHTVAGRHERSPQDDTKKDGATKETDDSNCKKEGKQDKGKDKKGGRGKGKEKRGKGMGKGKGDKSQDGTES